MVYWAPAYFSDYRITSKKPPGAFWFPVENREEPIKSVLSVRACVRVSRIISETAQRIFPKPGMKFGVKNVRNVARPLFEIFARFGESR